MDTSVPTANAETVRRGSRRQVLEVSWVVGVAAFTLVRLVVARETLGKYGLNIWLFGLIDLLTAVPYAVGVARVVGAMVDGKGRSAGMWFVVAVVSFAAPYGYVALAGVGASFPPGVYVVLGVLMAIFALNAIWSVARKVRSRRKASAGLTAIN